MTIKTVPFTPDKLIAAPRRSRPTVCDDISAGLYEYSKYSFEDQKTHSETRIIIVPYAEAPLDQSGRASNPIFLETSLQGDRGGTVLFLREREHEKGVTDLVAYEDVFADQRKEYLVGSFDGPVSNLKITKVGPAYYGIAVTGKASPDGSIYNSEKASKPNTTGRLYKSLFIRHWDEYVTPQKNTIFYAALLPKDDNDGNSHLFMTDPVNPLKGTGIESPVPTFGGSDNFDISPKGLIFVARDPNLSPALHTKCNIYLVPLSNFLETTPEIYSTVYDGLDGAKTSPVFNRDGTMAAFLGMAEDGYEADQNQIVVIDITFHPEVSTERRKVFTEPPFQSWDRSPDSICFSHDSKDLWLTADHYGEKCLFRTPVFPQKDEPPELVDLGGPSKSVMGLQPLPNGSVFIQASNYLDSTIWRTYDPSGKNTITLDALSSAIFPHKSDQPQVSSHFIDSSSSVTNRVQYWEIHPYNFDPAKKYPVALLIHGGPQSSWLNAWSTRWNPLVFAEQGYVVICPNITGSTGFGQDFVDSIQGQWGGRPYKDLEAVFAHLGKNVPYVDTDKAVALGASYGGFMVNWLQGQPLGRKFKALVCHDGVFSSKYELATDELYFISHEFRGPWNPSSPASRKAWSEWDPSEHTDQWATPQLVIHSEKDYRLTMADGLAAFNMLQSRGAESEFLTFSDENHFVQGRENSLRWHEAVLTFINEHVGIEG